MLSDDGSKVLVAGPAGSFGIYDATPQGDKSRKPVSTAGLAVDRVPAEEWNQIFNEAWRRYRDFFYVPNMHGYDWEALREQYKPLLKYVAHRSDLNYVIGEMISELTVQHAYIEGGDFQIPPRPRVALRRQMDSTRSRALQDRKIFAGKRRGYLALALTEIGRTLRPVITFGDQTAKSSSQRRSLPVLRTGRSSVQLTSTKSA